MKSGNINENKCIVYKLINLINNKIYIGQTWLELEHRMGRNGNNYRNSPKLFRAIRKYGVKNFKYEILFYCDGQFMADCLEFYYINKFDSKNPKIGYNIKDGGRDGKHSQESKEKIAKKMTGREISEETREKLSKVLKGINSHPRSEDFKNKVSESMKKWHSNHDHPLLGTTRTEEQKKSISRKLKGKKRKPEFVEKTKRALLKKYAMTEEQELEIIELYKSGIGINKITDILNINNRKIYRVFEKYNIIPRSKSELAVETNISRWKKHNEFIEAHEKEIVDMYLNGNSVNKIKIKFKTSSGKILEILEKYNISL